MIVTRQTILASADRIRGHVRRTPIMSVNGADFGLDHAVTLKLELFQHTGSFKARGAFNNLLAGNIPAAGIVAASGGNHGAAAAHAAAQLGIAARIFVPEIAGPTKIGMIRATGADLQVVPGRMPMPLRRRKPTVWTAALCRSTPMKALAPWRAKAPWPPNCRARRRIWMSCWSLSAAVD